MPQKNKKRIVERNFLKQTYSATWKFIKESRKFIYTVIAVFFGFALVGFFIPIPDYLAQEILKILNDIINKTKGMSQFELIKFIFFNNVQSSFIGLVLGVFLGIFPLFFAAFNGYILGFVVLKSVAAGGAGTLWRILPHGIFELPAVFISLGFGLRMGMLLFQRTKIKSFKYYFYELAKTFIFVVLPLLIIAAIIEGSLIFLFR